MNYLIDFPLHLSTAEADLDQAFEQDDFEKGIQLLKTFGLADVDMAFNGCDAIWELATNAPNAARLGKVGACEVVVDVSRAWGSADQGMAWNGCSAISNLAFENEANRVELGAAGACELVLDMLRTWGGTEADVAFYGCRAIACLAQNHANYRKLLKLGAVSLVLASLETECSQAAMQALD
jgi:hypothetical protein